MSMPYGSELANLAAAEDGWIIDMAALRRYDPDQDRRATQRAVLLAHLTDMLASGDARGFLMDGFTDSDHADEPDYSMCSTKPIKTTDATRCHGLGVALLQVRSTFDDRVLCPTQQTECVPLRWETPGGVRSSLSKER